MFEIRVEADFAAAHFLRDYHGKCENLHGHNYKVFAHVHGKNLDSGGMLLDFGELKSALREVCSILDHKNLNDFEQFAQNPSAEKIAKFIFDEISKRLDFSKMDAKLFAVDVFETETSRARYLFDG